MDVHRTHTHTHTQALATHRNFNDVLEGKNSSNCLNFKKKWRNNTQNVLIVSSFEGDDAKEE